MSNYKMDINRLKKDELTFELSIRGIAISSDQTVESLRSCLRQLCKMEKFDSSLHYPEYKSQPDTELAIIAEKLSELQHLVEQYLNDSLKVSVDTVQTRLIHLLKRTDLLGQCKLEVEQSNKRSEYLVKILGLIDSLENPKQVDVNVEPLFENILEAGATTSTSVPEINNSVNYASSTIKSIPVSKWGLKFTGEDKETSVYDFLERCNELLLARHISEKEIFESSIDLFEGKALFWFRSNRHRFENWQELCELLKKHYEPPDYKNRLLQDILGRTQDFSESIVDYLSCILSMFRRYGDISEAVQLGIISRNLAPFYTMQLPTVNSIQQLEEECLKLETKKYRVDNYNPPSCRSTNLVEPNFAFNIPKSSKSLGATTNRTNFVKPSSSNFRVSTVVCWNCQKEGHRSLECNERRKLHCFGCGKPDVTKKDCPKCSTKLNTSGQGNLPGRS